MAHANHWSDDEIEILKAHYAERGPFWVGWEMFLPDRTDSAIMRKANALGLKSGAKRTVTKRRRRKAKERDPVDIMVEGMMASGMAPSEIDRRMHWYEGTAVKILNGIWKGRK